MTEEAVKRAFIKGQELSVKSLIEKINALPEYELDQFSIMIHCSKDINLGKSEVDLGTKIEIDLDAIKESLNDSSRRDDKDPKLNFYLPHLNQAKSVRKSQILVYDEEFQQVRPPHLGGNEPIFIIDDVILPAAKNCEELKEDKLNEPDENGFTLQDHFISAESDKKSAETVLQNNSEDTNEAQQELNNVNKKLSEINDKILECKTKLEDPDCSSAKELLTKQEELEKELKEYEDERTRFTSEKERIEGVLASLKPKRDAILNEPCEMGGRTRKHNKKRSIKKRLSKRKKSAKKRKSKRSRR
jgi:uncharacterized protein YfcZ (UPF0381/DUF406 family)